MTIDKENLYKLIDNLPEAELANLARLLQALAVSEEERSIEDIEVIEFAKKC